MTSASADPWGVDQSPARTGPFPPLPPRLARSAELAAAGGDDEYQDAPDFPDPGELPEVQELMAAGWQPLHGAPLYCLLPAAWPLAHRAWLPDRLPRVSMGGTTETYFGGVHALPDDAFGRSDDLGAENAAKVGLPSPPSGRIWLVRSPWPRIPVAVIYDLLWSRVTDGPDVIEQMYTVARDVLSWTEARAWGSIPAESRDMLAAWADVGRVGEDAARLVEHRLTPAVVADARTRLGLDEAALIDWLDSLGSDLDDDVVQFIRAWHDAGLPGDPPRNAMRFRDRDPVELKAWLDAGFDLHAADQLERAGVDTAAFWRGHGFTCAETYELLRADPALSPAEAEAFHGAEDRREWIYYGFTASEARAWTAASIEPGAARLWRAHGHAPADVTPGHPLPPELDRAGTRTRYASFGGQGFQAWDDVPDPPGTRGRRARRRAGDDDAWINDD